MKRQICAGVLCIWGCVCLPLVASAEDITVEVFPNQTSTEIETFIESSTAEQVELKIDTANTVQESDIGHSVDTVTILLVPGNNTVDSSEGLPNPDRFMAPDPDSDMMGAHAAREVQPIKYAYLAGFQSEQIENLKYGYTSWQLPNAKIDDLEWIADDLSILYDLNPSAGNPSSYRMDMDGQINIQFKERSVNQAETNQRVQDKVNEIFDIVDRSGISDMELAEAYAQWLRANATYNRNAQSHISDNDYHVKSYAYTTSTEPYGVLIEGSGVCGSYAQALMLLLRRSGIPAIVESGTVGDGPHQWTVAYLDGEWYSLDPTFYKTGGSLVRNYPIPDNIEYFIFER